MVIVVMDVRGDFALLRGGIHHESKVISSIGRGSRTKCRKGPTGNCFRHEPLGLA
jgi:hypothetical protein